MLASKDFRRADSGNKGRIKSFRGFGDRSGSTAFSALADRRLVLTPEFKAFFGVSARFRKVFSINEKVCAGPGLPLVPPVLPDELLLFLDIRLPEEAGDLVVAGPDPAEHVLDARGRVGHAQGVLHPGADLLGVVERPRGDLPLEPLDLGGPETTGIAPVVQGAEFLEPL